MRLFERDNRRVELTDAGATLLAESARVLDALEAATQRTRRTGRALVATAKPGMVSSLLRHIVEAHPAPVEIMVSGYDEQVGLVRTGRVDVALIGSPHEHDRLETEPLTSEPRVAALPAGHPLTTRAALTVADLADHPAPRWPGGTRVSREYWTGRAEPVPGPTVSDGAQLLEVVGLGQAVALVPASFAEDCRRADVVYRPVTDAAPYTVAVAWASGSRDRRLAEFVHTATRVARQERQTA